MAILATGKLKYFFVKHLNMIFLLRVDALRFLFFDRSERCVNIGKKRDLMRQLEASLYTLNLPQEQQQQIATMDATCDTIVSVFKTKELDTGDQRKASAIYISYLVGMESGDTFYDDLANCFLNTTADKDVYDLVSETFLVVVSEEDQTKMDQLYGVTPTRVTEETTGEAQTSSPEPSS